MLHALTTKQRKVRDYYRAYIHEHEYPPTYEQASKDLHVSPSVVHHHVKNLQKIGYYPRSVEHEIGDASRLVRIPLLGEVACGEPIDIHAQVQDYIEISGSSLHKSREYYALKARGESMIDAGICDGDTLIIQKQDTADDGDIAVVVVQEEGEERATLKKIFHRPDSLILQPANDVFPLVVLHKQPVQLRGKLIRIMRDY